MSSQLKDLLSDTTEIGIFMIWLLNRKEWNGWGPLGTNDSNPKMVDN